MNIKMLSHVDNLTYRDCYTDKYADSYYKHGIEERHVTMGKFFGSVLDAFREKSKGEEKAPKLEHLVDLGCASGKQTVHLAKYFDRATAVDISEAQISKARSAWKGSNIDFKIGCSEKIPVSDTSADVISAIFSAHFFNMNEFVEEAKRVLKPQGFAVLMLYQVVGITPGKEQKVGIKSHPEAGHLWEEAREKMLKYAKEIHHPEQHNLENYKSLYENVKGINKSWGYTTEFSLENSLEKWKNFYHTGPYYREVDINKSIEVLLRDIKKLWHVERKGDDDVIARFSFKAYSIILSKN